MQLIQKFVPRSHFGIFRNERSRSTPLDPKLMFCYVSYCLDAFGTVSLPNETRCKPGWNGAINAKVRATKSCRNFRNERSWSTHWTLNSCFGTCHTVWMHLGPFCCLMKLGAKRDEMVQLMQKFVPQSRVGIFRNKRSRSTPLDPKLTFWCVSYYLGAFGNRLVALRISVQSGTN